MLDDDQMAALENEVDNIAPKIVGVLGLSGSCMVKELRVQMVKHCLEYQSQLHAKGNRDEAKEQDDSVLED